MARSLRRRRERALTAEHRTDTESVRPKHLKGQFWFVHPATPRARPVRPLNLRPPAPHPKAPGGSWAAGRPRRPDPGSRTHTPLPPGGARPDGKRSAGGRRLGRSSPSRVYFPSKDGGLGVGGAGVRSGLGPRRPAVAHPAAPASPRRAEVSQCHGPGRAPENSPG